MPPVVRLVLLAGVSGALWAGEAQAGGGVGLSRLSRADAVARATQWKPINQVVTAENCTEMVVDSSSQWSCYVQWAAPAGQ